MSKKMNLGDLITDNKENAEDLSAADIKVASDKDKIEKKILENKQNSKEISAGHQNAHYERIGSHTKNPSV